MTPHAIISFHGRNVDDAPAVTALKATYWSKIAILAPVRGSRRNIAITVQKN